VRALVTGGAGFIGSNLVDRMVGEGADVVVIDDLSTGQIENLHPAAELVEADIADEGAVRRTMRGCEVVFHEAAHRAVSASVERPLATNRANVEGTLNVLVAARDEGARRVVYASSSSVYGGAAPLPTPESAPLCPKSPYAVSKLAAEQYCRVFWELFGLETVALRYFNVYGPRQRLDSKYAAVIPLFIDALMSGRAPVVHGDGRQSRDFTFIDDVVEANLRAAGAPVERCAGRAYNIAGGRESTLLELLETMETIVGKSVRPVHGPSRPGDVRHSRAHATAAQRDLGFQAAVLLPDGLRRTVAWFAARPEPFASRPGRREVT
jgi:nucleoside-diphosphate-sugar epimerase